MRGVGGADPDAVAGKPTQNEELEHSPQSQSMPSLVMDKFHGSHAVDQNESSGTIGRQPIIASACRAFAPQARLDGRSPNFDSFSVIAIDQSAWDAIPKDYGMGSHVQTNTGGGAPQHIVSIKQDDVDVYKS